MKKYIMATAVVLGMGSAQAMAQTGHLSNATIQSIKQGATQPNGSSCWYIQLFIAAQNQQAAFLPYTFAINKLGDLAGATLISTHRDINFDYTAPNKDCKEFAEFDAAPSMLLPSVGTEQ